MITKPADYIITDCGYPQCSWPDERLPSPIAADYYYHPKLTTFMLNTELKRCGKLLPLRETLTDYCYERLLQKIEPKRAGHDHNEDIDADPAQREKRAKNRHNELVKQAGLKVTNSSNQNTLDKRRRQRSSRMETATVVDSDLDVF